MHHVGRLGYKAATQFIERLPADDRNYDDFFCITICAKRVLLTNVNFLRLARDQQRRTRHEQQRAHGRNQVQRATYPANTNLWNPNSTHDTANADTAPIITSADATIIANVPNTSVPRTNSSPARLRSLPFLVRLRTPSVPLLLAPLPPVSFAVMNMPFPRAIPSRRKH